MKTYEIIIEILDDETITLDGVKYVRVGEPSECEKDVVTTTTPLIDSPDEFIEQLKADIEDTNKLYPRCTPLSARSYAASLDSVGITLGEHFVVNFHIYRVAEVTNA